MVVKDTCCPLCLTLPTISSCCSESTDSPLTSNSNSPSLTPALSAGLSLSITRRTWTIVWKERHWKKNTHICLCLSFFLSSYTCVQIVSSPTEAGSRSLEARRPGGVFGPYKAGYVEQPCWVGWASSVACTSSHFHCQSLGWWCDYHIFSSTAKHDSLLGRNMNIWLLHPLSILVK